MAESLTCRRCGFTKTLPDVIDGQPARQWYKARFGFCSKCLKELASLLPSPLEPGVALRRDAPETSKTAAFMAFPGSGTERYRVLVFIHGRDSGATDEELQTALRMNPSTERPRRGELVRGKWIEDSGRTRAFRSGAEGTVWVATLLANTRLRQAGAA